MVPGFPTDCRLDWNWWGPLGVTGFPGFLVGWCGTLMRMRVPSRVLNTLANFQSLKAYQGPCLRSKWYHTEGCWRTIENCVTAVRHTNPLLGISWGTSYKCMFFCTSEVKLLHWEDRPGGILPVWSIGLTSTASQSQSSLQCWGKNSTAQGALVSTNSSTKKNSCNLCMFKCNWSPGVFRPWRLINILASHDPRNTAAVWDDTGFSCRGMRGILPGDLPIRVAFSWDTFQKTHCTSPSNEFSTQLLFNFCVTKTSLVLHWLVVSKPCKMNHWGLSKSCGWTKTCWNRQPDQQSFKQFQGHDHMFSIPQPRCVSHRPLSPVLPESCFMLFNPVRSWATRGKTGGNYGSGRLYQRELFFSFPGGGNLQNAQNGAWSFTCSVCFHYFVWEETQMNSSQSIVILIIGLIEGNILTGKSQSIWWTKTHVFSG